MWTGCDAYCVTAAPAWIRLRAREMEKSDKERWAGQGASGWTKDGATKRAAAKEDLY